MTLTQINKAGLDELALDHVFTIGASGTDHYTFQGEGLNGTVNDPTLYLTRGKTYRFENGTGAHAIRIQSADNGTSGTLYNTGVTNNNTTGTVIVEVQHDAPDVLYYQCANHANMKGILYINGALADGTVTEAKLASNSVSNAKLTNSSVDENKLAINSVTTAKIADDAVTIAKIAANAVGSSQIAQNAVSLDKLEQGNSSNNGKFLRANNGADPTFETVSQRADNSIFSLYDQSGSPVQRVLVSGVDVTIQGSSAGVSKLAFRDRTTANFLRFKPVDTLAGNVEFTLPSADGSSGQFLKTDGSGVLSFSALPASGVTVSNNVNNRLVTGDGTNLNAEADLTYDGNSFVLENSAANIAAIRNGGGATITLHGNPDSGNTAATNNHDMGNIAFKTADGTDRNNVCAYITGRAVGTFTNSSHPTQLEFWTTASSSTTVTKRAIFTSSGQFVPAADNTYDLGDSSTRWRNIYTADLQMSNKGSSNDVDGTWGNYTIQEGESDLFLINNRSGKKYKFNLTEVS